MKSMIVQRTEGSRTNNGKNAQGSSSVSLLLVQAAQLSKVATRTDCPPSGPALRCDFPFKLHHILEDAARSGNEHIISWLPTGKAFRIHSREAFEARILPLYTTKTGAPKYRSFCRQLSLYGFRMVRDLASDENGAYRHPLMVRTMPSLWIGVRRESFNKKKGTQSKSKPNVTSSGINSTTISVMDMGPSSSPVPSLARTRTITSSCSNAEGKPKTLPVMSLRKLHGGGCMVSSTSSTSTPTGREGWHHLGEDEPTNPTSQLPLLERSDDSSEEEDNLLEFAIVANEFLEARKTSTPTSSTPLPTSNRSNCGYRSTAENGAGDVNSDDKQISFGTIFQEEDSLSHLLHDNSFEDIKIWRNMIDDEPFYQEEASTSISTSEFNNDSFPTLFP